ncbi:MAG: glycoside hydrolase family 3 C-terminal domain-containing protein [Lachnospiraceae bacterium]|nr:glycoside hydrolase family 3 C-terminal domain-containing protein [Lachnospiraceae bacterium]
MTDRIRLTRVAAILLSMILLCACGARTPDVTAANGQESVAEQTAADRAEQIDADRTDQSGTDAAEPAGDEQAQLSDTDHTEQSGADGAGTTGEELTDPSGMNATEPAAEEPAPEEDDPGMDAHKTEDIVAGQMLAAMDTKHKLAQMLMPDIRIWKEAVSGKGVTTLGPELADAIARYGFGGVILFAENLEDAEQAAALTASLQEANAKGGNPAGLLIAVDQEGGAVTRIATGTAMPGNMALGATGDPGDVKRAAQVTGEELAALGICLDLAPVLDVNSNPANPVIGIRSYSDDPVTVGTMALACQEGLHDAGVMTALKHFPGHGDTATDSHTGLPVIDKSLEELRQTDLLPYLTNTDSADLVMTAHIRYPQIERETYISKKTGKEITLPATLSRTILTDLLRGELNYDGVIITDAMNMQAIAAHFAPLDAARLAINAGADLLLMPVEMDSEKGIRAMGEYIDALAEMADRGEIPQERIDASVTRILKLKVRYGLFADAGTADPEAASKVVGSRAHHDIEWEIAGHAVTCLKNEGGLLPLSGREQVVIACPEPVMTRSGEYAAGRLREEGILPQDAKIRIVSYGGSSAARALEAIRGADTVVGISAVSSLEEMDPADRQGAGSAFLDSLIAETHKAGGRFVLLSAGLPYDTARFPEADAILACYNAEGMPERPKAEGGTRHYGPNIPAALYTIFGGSTPAGRLPVNIPRLDGATYAVTDSILYPRGTGIGY